MCVFMCNYEFFFIVCVPGDPGAGFLSLIHHPYRGCRMYATPGSGAHSKKGNICNRFGVPQWRFLLAGCTLPPLPARIQKGEPL